jgi:hypothetical protein
MIQDNKGPNYNDKIIHKIIFLVHNLKIIHLISSLDIIKINLGFIFVSSFLIISIFSSISKSLLLLFLLMLLKLLLLYYYIIILL